jgi:hypothetical protein
MLKKNLLVAVILTMISTLVSANPIDTSGEIIVNKSVEASTLIERLQALMLVRTQN